MNYTKNFFYALYIPITIILYYLGQKNTDDYHFKNHDYIRYVCV